LQNQFDDFFGSHCYTVLGGAPMLAIVLGLIGLMICGWLGSYAASAKGRSGSEGWLFGCLLGPFGILIVAMLPTLEVTQRRPPMEQSPISFEPAKKCRYSGSLANYWAQQSESAPRSP
jgi:hypothetical protein